MKTWILALAGIASGLYLVAQDGPQQAGSQTVARPKKKADPSAGASTGATTAPAAPAAADDSDLPKIPSKLSPKNKVDADEADASFTADANIVTVDAAVIDSKGRFIPNIPKGNFRILEDNIPQTVTQYAMGTAPMTVALVVEFNAAFQSYWSRGWYQTLQAVYGFKSTLKPDDYLAVIAYDIRPTILADFTNDPGKIEEALGRLRIPGFSESNMFDALTDTADRMKKIEGRKAILLIASGIDTLSKLTFDKARKQLQEAGVPIYSISILQAERDMADASGAMGAIQRMDFLQADNELRTFAKETGGQAYFPHFLGEMPQAFNAISQALRNQYSLGYSSSNSRRDGKFRKITVQLVNPATNEPLKVMEDGKSVKYTVVAKAGYNAPLPVQ
jgi:VWFA-related protein